MSSFRVSDPVQVRNSLSSGAGAAASGVADGVAEGSAVGVITGSGAPGPVRYTSCAVVASAATTTSPMTAIKLSRLRRAVFVSCTVWRAWYWRSLSRA